MTIDLKAITQSIRDWLEQMAVGLELGRFHFCAKGSLVPTTGKAGLVSTCFAMRSAWQAGIWDEWPKERRKACVEFVQSFQRQDGFFYDPWLFKNSNIGLKTIALVFLGRVSFRFLFHHKEMNLRAETRQCVGDLFNVGFKPLIPLPLEFQDTKNIRKYIQSLDWCNPWSAGSHLSHLMCFFSVSREYFDQPETYESLVDEILQMLSELHDKKTGTWFLGSPSDVLKINGAMKVLSGLQWLDREYPNTENLIDFALAQPIQNDGCGILNRLFVLQQARKKAPHGYRQKEIRKTAFHALDTVQEFQNSNGGFSFYKHKSQTSYYGAKISKGFAVSDLHGTAMMTWAIAIALDLLGEDAPEGAKKWKYHRA